MPNGWRFRQGMWGGLVLQRHVGSDGPAREWVDASTTDYHLFIEAIRARGH